MTIAAEPLSQRACVFVRSVLTRLNSNKKRKKTQKPMLSLMNIGRTVGHEEGRSGPGRSGQPPGSSEAWLNDWLLAGSGLWLVVLCVCLYDDDDTDQSSRRGIAVLFLSVWMVRRVSVGVVTLGLNERFGWWSDGGWNFKMVRLFWKAWFHPMRAKWWNLDGFNYIWNVINFISNSRNFEKKK